MLVVFFGIDFKTMFLCVENVFTIFSISYGREYIPIGLAFLDSISRTFFVLPKLNNLIVSQSLVSLRDQIYTKLIGTQFEELKLLKKCL